MAETFATAYLERESMPDDYFGERAGAWLDRLARRKLAEFYRRGRVEPREVRYGLTPPETRPLYEGSLEEVVKVRDLENRLTEGIARLPEREKLVVGLHAYENLSFDEIGDVLGVPISDARRYYAEALRALSGLVALERDAGEPHPAILGPDGSPIGVDAPERAALELRVAEISEELISRLAATPELLYELSPRRFEELVAELYGRRGFEVTLTPPTGDEGVDVFVARHDELGTSLTVVQCKRYAPPHKVGAALVRELKGTVHSTGASAGVLLTMSFFTSGARRLEERFRYQLSLQDYFALLQLLQLPRKI